MAATTTANLHFTSPPTLIILEPMRYTRKEVYTNIENIQRRAARFVSNNYGSTVDCVRYDQQPSLVHTREKKTTLLPPLDV